ncbi:hypothetical protein JCM6882_002831 [Rhodosporidiobolus microsporus]
MLDRLFPELIDLVLDQVGNRPSLHTRDKERRRTLYACSLVSKVLRQRAQPKLWEKLELLGEDDTEGFAFLLDGGGDNGGQLRHSVRILDSSHGSQIGLKGTVSFPRGFALASLVELVLEDTFIDRAQAVYLFTTTCLPSLRVLAVLGFDDFLSNGHTPSFPAAFLDQLDIIQANCLWDNQLNCWPNNNSPPFPLSSPTPIVCRVPFKTDSHSSVLDDLFLLQPRHLSISDPNAEPRLLDDVRTFVTSTSKPISLHLPTSLRSSTSPLVISALAALQQACSQQGVEVVWYEANETDEVDNSDLAVAKESWAWARGFKARARAAAAEEAGGSRS